MKRATLYILTLLSLLSTTAAAQYTAGDSISRNALDNIIVRTAIKQSLFPEERAYLHFDNSAYYLGETMWFKAYVMSGENDTPTDISRVLYVELVAPEGYVVKTNKYRIGDDGTCHGMFELNQLLLSGYYEIRAYTRYMLNRGKESIFSRVFPVFDKVNADNWDFKNMLDRRRGFLMDVETDTARQGLEREVEWVSSQLPECDLKFYPEGGHLVKELESRVAFEVFGADGINSERSITLLADGKELLTVQPEHMGMGAFTFTPEDGTDYTAVLIDGKKKKRFDLPEVEYEGAVLKINDAQGIVTINVKNNLELETEVGCAVLHRSKTLFYERYPSTEREITFAVDKNSLAEGVNRVVLFIGDSIPLAERMFFVTHDRIRNGDHQSARLTVTGNGSGIDSLEVEPYEKISISIAREDGKPIEGGNFSLSVSDADNSQETSYSYDIYSYMLLGSEVKGYIPNASRYFDTANPDRAKELDLIMLTHGWTSYDWSKLSRKETQLEQPIEKGITIKGRYVKKVPNRKIGQRHKMTVTNRPGTKVVFNMNYTDSVITSYDFATDNNGEFRIRANDFYGKRVAHLQPILEGYTHPDDSMFAFVLDRYFSPGMRLYDYWERNVGKAMSAEELEKYNSDMVKINPFEYLLSNVEVISKKKKEQYYRPPRSEMRLDYLDEWEYAQDITYLNRKASWRPEPYGNDYVINFRTPMEIQEGSTFSNLRFLLEDDYNYYDARHPYDEEYDHSRIKQNVPDDEITDPAFNSTLTAFDILRSAFWRHNLNWCYWIQSIVVDGEYSSDSIPAINEEFLEGVHPEKMTDFKEIVIRSDENIRKLHQMWEVDRKRRNRNIGNFNYSSFYTSFTSMTGIPPRSGEIDSDPSAIRYQIYQRSGEYKMNQTSIPNYVACFIPNKGEDATKGIIPALSRYNTSRYTMVYGYTESKEFYSPDYSTARPDSTIGDYRRTLLWVPQAQAEDDGTIQVELYNSGQAKRIAVDVEGYAGGTFYSNSDITLTRENEETAPAGTKRLKVTPIIGIQEPDLLVHCFKLNEEGRMLYMQDEYKKAFDNFNEAAALGYPDAIFNTGVCYLHGQGVEKDSTEAFKCFRKAANMEQEDALHNLASCYMQGIGTAKNDSLGIMYYTLSADKGLAISQSMLGHCYLNGNGVAQDSIKAREWYDKAAAQDEPRALFAIATIMEREDSIAGYSKRKLRKQPTVTYLERAATNRHIDAQYKLAQCYEKGWYVKKSKKKAFNWYLRAANQGHPEAMELVGYCYEKGRGVKKDEHRAAKWYRLAEQNGQEYARKKMEWYNALHFFEE